MLIPIYLYLLLIVLLYLLVIPGKQCSEDPDSIIYKVNNKDDTILVSICAIIDKYVDVCNFFVSGATVIVHRQCLCSEMTILQHECLNIVA